VYISEFIIGAFGATAFWAIVLFVIAILKAAGSKKGYEK